MVYAAIVGLARQADAVVENRVDPPDFFDLVHARHTVQAFRSYQAVIMQAFQ